MRSFMLFLLAVSIQPLAGATAQARVSHGVSPLLIIDTVTRVPNDAGAPPSVTILAAIYPNPFNPRTVIEFDLAASGPIELAIFDVRGRMVQVIDAGPRSAGRYGAIWDGQDAAGHAVPTGTYFCRLSAGLDIQTRKLTLVR